MPIGGSATELIITGAKLKVSGGVQVSGSIAYTTDADGFGGVSAQIDNDNTLNVTSGKLTGVTKIERATAATINAITHTNVNNNTTIHLALKNTSTTDKGIFITLETFASDDTVKVNYTDDYMIGPGETGMLTLRKVNNVLSVFVREMFSSKATSFNPTDNSPFYIKDGVNYKYPLYKYTASGLTSITINSTEYFRPTVGITTKSRPPKGLPENITPPSASGFAIGNTGDLTTINYDVIGVPSSFDFGSITDNGGTTQTRFLLTDGEAAGSFTESGASSGDSYKLFIEKTDTNLTDTVSAVVDNTSRTVAFHHGAFSASDYFPTTIGGTVLNSQTWWVSTTGTYANQLVYQYTSGTQYYYLGSNLHNDGYDRSENLIYFDTSDSKWHDGGDANPVSFRVGTIGSETPAESTLPTSETNTGFVSDTVSVGDNVIIYRGTSLQQAFSFTQPSFGIGGTVEEAATAGFVYSDTVAGDYTWGTLGTISSTSLNTTYTWTPPGDLTANLLMVAGGGGAGRDQAGGGGAGGLIFKTGYYLSGTKTVVVGAGGASASSYDINPGVGNNTTFDGLTTLGGGGGSYGHTNAPTAIRNGGSGGGGDGEGRSTGAGQGLQSSSASGGYGNNSGSGGSNNGGGGGGGAGTAGSGPNGNSGGSGGDGLKEVTISSTTYNFATVFGGAIYGEVLSGESWFAGGGGAGGNGAGNFSGGKGGGGDATNASSGQVGDDGAKHTGGGGGGSWSSSLAGGSGGSGIAMFNWSGIQVGKTIPKVTDIVIDPTNDSNVLISTQGTGISSVTYSVGSGSEVSAPVSQLSVAHGLAENVTATLLAYALNASSARLGVKLSKSITSPFGYETFTITQHTNASSTLSITGNGTDNITSVYKNSGSSAWDAGFYTPTFTAPITLEFNKTAPSTTSLSDVRIGITDTPTVNTTTMLDNMSYYFRSRQTFKYQMSSPKGLSVTDGTAWDGSKKHYIVYKTNGGLEFWNGNDLKFSVANWGTGKSVRFETGHLDNNSTLNNTLTNIRMKRREWDGTKYIN